MSSNGSEQNDSRAGRREIASVLRRLAVRAGQASRADEFKLLSESLAPISDALAYMGSAPSSSLQKVATRQLVEGAFESAILSLIPASATVSCVRIGTLKVSAQVILVNHPGHHAREAPTLALGWLFALAHSLADLLEQSPAWDLD